MKNLYKSLFLGLTLVVALLLVKIVLAQEAPKVEVPDHLQLKASKDRMLGSVEANGVVKYAYRSDSQISDRPSTDLALQAQREGVDIQREIVEKRTKNSRTFQTDKPGTYVAEIISGVPQYYKDDNGTWWQAEYATTTKQAFDQQVSARTLGETIAQFFLPSTHADTGTFYPQEYGSEISSVDGAVSRQGVDEAFSTIINGSGNSVVDDIPDGGAMAQVEGSGTSNQYAVIRRGIFLFNTSSIGASNGIISASLSLWVENKANGLSGQSSANSAIVITSSAPASNTTLVNADFTTLGSIDFGRTGIQSGLSTSAYTVITLNSSGLSNISKTGISKFGTRYGWDIDATATGLTWANGGQQYTNAFYAETSGTSQDPKLIVVYSTAPTTGYKSVAESRTSNTTLTDDAQLQLSLATSTTYLIEGTVFAVASSTNPDMVIAFTVPTGAVMNIGYITGQAQSDEGELLRTSGTASTRITLGTTPKVIQIKGTVRMGPNAGGTILQWAQNNSNSNATSILEGSYLKAEILN